MKLSWGIAAASTLACTATATVRPAVSPDTARLILAQRLGVSRFHSLDAADATAIRHINTFGGRPRALFGRDHAGASRAHLLVWVDNAAHDEATGTPSSSPPTPPPRLPLGHSSPRLSCSILTCASHRQRRI